MPREKSIFTRDYETFLSTLRRLREDSGRTQSDVAKVLKRDQSVVSKCERGERRMDIIEVRVYCRAIGMELEKFIRILETDIVGTARGRISPRLERRTAPKR
jgi:transcriptional regulator with XRE-family HTH domain